jgi:hypothetical protein
MKPIESNQQGILRYPLRGNPCWLFGRTCPLPKDNGRRRRRRNGKREDKGGINRDQGIDERARVHGGRRRRRRKRRDLLPVAE